MENLDLENTILMFTDGACSGNPGKGGYGVVIASPDGQVAEYGKHESATTNNRMEMAAVIRGLDELAQTPGDLWVLTDSTYVIRGITEWIWGWRKRGWKTASGTEVSNKDLWQSLDQAVQRRQSLEGGTGGSIDWKYVRGHIGTPGNERCDAIAVAFTHKQYVDLYKGPLLQYSEAIYDLPDDMALPAMRKKTEKKVAHSYLSYVNGKLERHSNWKACEAKVKGRPGAKFKKSSSAANESEIVSGWGLSPETLKKI